MGNLWVGEKIKLKPIDEGKFLKYLTSKDYQDSDYTKLVDCVEPLRTLGKLKEDIEKMAKSSGEKDSYYWMIEDFKGNIVGDINTYKCDRHNGTFMFGIAILKDYWKKGYASEAIKIMLRYFFNELRYQKVTSHVYSFNEISQKLHEKLGFTYEGRLRNMLYTDGEFHDHIYYGMTKAEFDQLEDDHNG